MLAVQWLENARMSMDRIAATQLDEIRKAAAVMADSVQAGRWVHTFGCGHATLPVVIHLISPRLDPVKLQETGQGA